MFNRIMLLVVLTIVCHGAVRGQDVPDAPRKPFIIDTDMAADDWMAIAKNKKGDKVSDLGSQPIRQAQLRSCLKI